MSRVLAVVDNSIMVKFADVKPNDILHISGDERDPIIERVEFDGRGLVRLHYKPRNVLNQWYPVNSNWMETAHGNHIFIHDLYNERADFEKT